MSFVLANSCNAIVYRVRPKNIQDFARCSHVSTETDLHIARKRELETTTELSYDHRKTRATSEGCRRNMARWSWVYHLHYEIK